MSQCHDTHDRLKVPGGLDRTIPATGRNHGSTVVVKATAPEEQIDLEAVAAHLTGVGPYTYEDARDDMGKLIATVNRLEEQRAVVAHLIKLAILHGASQLAKDRLNDALIELGQEG